jgi:hypothetical protein
MKSPSTWAVLALSLLPAVTGSPLFQKRAKGPWLGLNTDFPDPSFMKAADNKWYAFGTNGNGKRVQVATSDDFVSWKLLDVEALPTLSTWETEIDHWAPDVVMRVSSLIFRNRSKQNNPETNPNQIYRTTESMSCTTPAKQNPSSDTTVLAQQ